ncbi:unnamed protein product [Vitrella brassicaformis CCMP3155]|uniref:Uncharacterized protein n=2 Tax=Vitrella brassicaformis TaxID=1169539 RepID=A0A0G4EWJ9_VITBC|nr:unnamed protein product [Vitrella brassicaformis CCMP3155]|eukprot:CEM02633.1 unnamed protein product [Vitrella brassicaformis CCMP3155]
MLQNIMDDNRCSMKLLRQQYDKRIEEFQAQRDDYKRERDAYRRERDAALHKLRELEAKMAAEQAVRVSRTVVPEGAVYHGTMRRIAGIEVAHGKGKEISHGRIVYDGDFVDGKRHGQGEEFASRKSIYKGGWADGERDGAGVATGIFWEQGCKYHGPTRDGKPHGEGELRDGDKVIYKGGYKDGKRHGRGTELTRDGRVLYEGEWANGDRTNKGEGKVGSMELKDDKRKRLGYYFGETLDAACQMARESCETTATESSTAASGRTASGMAKERNSAQDMKASGRMASGTARGRHTTTAKKADGIPRCPITPIRWQAGQKIPNINLVPGGGWKLHQLLQDRGVSEYFPAGAL